MIDLAKQADEAELAFIQAARVATTDEDDAKVKVLCGEYLNVLRLMRLRLPYLEARIIIGEAR